MAPSRAITTALRGPAEPAPRAPGRSGPTPSTHPSSTTAASRARRSRRVGLARIRPGHLETVQLGPTRRLSPIFGAPITARAARRADRLMPAGAGHSSERVEYEPVLPECNASGGGEAR